MGKSLVITEKPSVARDIVSALGGFTDHDGYWESDDYVVTFSVGHIVELLSPEDVDPDYKRWVLENLPILPEEFKLKKKSGQSDRIRLIGKLLKRDDVDDVINACDAGREGELIFREILEFVGVQKPTRRLWLQSMTTNAIRSGFASLRPGSDFDGLGDAARCRSRSDWLIGMNATRALTRRLQSRREKQAWSAGRVQTPTLAIVCDRELEILSHVPRPYWRLEARFAAAGHEYAGTWFDPGFRASEQDDDLRDDRIFDESRARVIAAAVEGRSGEARETRKPSRETAPPLFDLTSLQREGNRRFGWSARRTLNAAQRCYERHKILTYPRTNSRALPSDYRAQVGETLATLASQGSYRAEARKLLDDGLQNEKRTFDDSKISDHFAIIPTGKLPRDLAGDDARLFDLVVRRFLATFYPPAVWNRVERITKVGEHSFRSRSRTLDEPGWRAVLGQAEQEDQALPPLVPGQSEAEGVGARMLEVEQHDERTRPPPRITEARLLSLMENAGKEIEDEELAMALDNKGIGTPATRADIIENLIAKGYLQRIGKALRPTVKGIRLVDVLRRVHIDRLASPELTGSLEHHLSQVERAERSADDFMSEIVEYTKEIVERAKEFNYEDLYPDGEPFGPCPLCKRPVYERSWFYRCKEVPGVERDDDCPFRIWKDKAGRYMDHQTVRTLLKEGQTPPLEGFSYRDGRTYAGILRIDDEGELQIEAVAGSEGARTSDVVEYEVDDRPLGSCPMGCGAQVIETPTEFVCTTRKESTAKGTKKDPHACSFLLPRTVCRREITRDEAEKYIRDKRTEMLSDFISRYGRPFAATLFLKENGRHGFEFAPREARKGTRKKTTRKKAASKKGTRKKATRKKTARKKAAHEA